MNTSLMFSEEMTNAKRFDWPGVSSGEHFRQKPMAEDIHMVEREQEAGKRKLLSLLKTSTGFRLANIANSIEGYSSSSSSSSAVRWYQFFTWENCWICEYRNSAVCAVRINWNESDELILVTDLVWSNIRTRSGYGSPLPAAEKFNGNKREHENMTPI